MKNEYSFAVDYDQSFGDLIKSIPFTWVSDEISSMCFDFARSGLNGCGVILDGKVFDLGSFSLKNLKQVIQKLNESGYRPGTAREFLSYCYAQRYESLSPNEPSLLVAIGSSYEEGPDKLYILGVDIFDCEYNLILCDISQEVNRPIFAVRITENN